MSALRNQAGGHCRLFPDKRKTPVCVSNNPHQEALLMCD